MTFEKDKCINTLNNLFSLEAQNKYFADGVGQQPFFKVNIAINYDYYDY